MTDRGEYSRARYRRLKAARQCVRCKEPLSGVCTTIQCGRCKRQQAKYDHFCALSRARRQGTNLWRVVVDGMGCGTLLRPWFRWRKKEVASVQA